MTDGRVTAAMTDEESFPSHEPSASDFGERVLLDGDGVRGTPLNARGPWSGLSKPREMTLTYWRSSCVTTAAPGSR
jgi:hypothetical protein